MFSLGFEKTAGIGSAIASGARKAGEWAVKNPGKALSGAAAVGTAANLAQGKGVRQSLTSSVLAPNYKEASEKVATGLLRQAAVYGRKAAGWAAKNPGKAIGGAAALGVGANLAQGKGVRQSLTSSVLAPNYQEA